MQPRVQLATEALVVGVTLATAMALVVALFPGAAVTPLRAAATGLALGAAFHLTFEIAGLNRTYCATGHACIT